MSDILDQTIIANGIIQPHAPFHEHPTSGYRILEQAYAEIIQGLPAEIKTIVPLWDQIYMERFHSGFVDRIDLATWDQMLQLSAEE